LRESGGGEEEGESGTEKEAGEERGCVFGGQGRSIAGDKLDWEMGNGRSQRERRITTATGGQGLEVVPPTRKGGVWGTRRRTGR